MDTTFARMMADGLKFWRRPAETSDRSDVNDFSAALGDHDLANCLRKEECPGQIRLDHFVPLLELPLFDGGAPGRTGIIDQDIDPAEAGDRRVHNRLHMVGVLDVAAQSPCLHAELPRFFRGLFTSLLLASAKHQVGAHFGQTLGHLPAQPDGAPVTIATLPDRLKSSLTVIDCAASFSSFQENPRRRWFVEDLLAQSFSRDVAKTGPLQRADRTNRAREEHMVPH